MVCGLQEIFSFLFAGSVWVLLQRACFACVFIRNDVLLGLYVLLQRVLIQSAYADFIIPRGGGRRDREGFANPSLPLQHLSTHPGESAAAGTLPLTARGYRGIVRCNSGSLGSHTLQSFSLGIGSYVFHYWLGAVDFSYKCALFIFLITTQCIA